jgi:hypothetical protein
VAGLWAPHYRQAGMPTLGPPNPTRPSLQCCQVAPSPLGDAAQRGSHSVSCGCASLPPTPCLPKEKSRVGNFTVALGSWLPQHPARVRRLCPSAPARPPTAFSRFKVLSQRPGTLWLRVSWTGWKNGEQESPHCWVMATHAGCH